MYYVGVDLHKESSWFYVMDEGGKRISSKNISNNQCTLKEYLQNIPKPFKIGVESTYNWYFLVDMAEEYAEKVYLGDSYQLKAFTKKHKKTDKIDARLIAEVLRKGYFPEVTIPNKEIRKMKETLKYRINIVRDRTRETARLKALLDKLGKNAIGDFTSYKQLDKINIDCFSETYQEIIRGYIEKIKYLTNKIYQIEKHISKEAVLDEDIKNLMTIPGISYFSASLIKSEIIDIKRFQSFNRLCAYAGLAPRVYQSADNIKHGPLNVNRRKNLQWILIENTYHYVRTLPEKKEKHMQIEKRKGYNTANVALARDMLKIIFHILKEKRAFYIKNNNEIRSVATPALSGV